jgi:hypothetical protein
MEHLVQSVALTMFAQKVQVRLDMVNEGQSAQKVDWLSELHLVHVRLFTKT